MKYLVFLGAMLTTAALAAPRAESALECGIAADMAVDAAYGSRRNAEASAQKFAEDLFATCMKSGGNMDTVLGRRL